MKKRMFLSVILFFSLVIPHAWEGDVWTESLQKINSIVSVIESSYFQEVDHESLAHSSINGMLQTLDPHSYFLNLKNLRTLQEEYKGKYHGLGIMIQKLGDNLVVITPIEGTPAYRLGILAGDVISHIEGESTKTLSSFEAMQKGTVTKSTGSWYAVRLDEPSPEGDINMRCRVAGRFRLDNKQLTNPIAVGDLQHAELL